MLLHVLRALSQCTAGYVCILCKYTSSFLTNNPLFWLTTWSCCTNTITDNHTASFQTDFACAGGGAARARRCSPTTQPAPGSADSAPGTTSWWGCSCTRSLRGRSAGGSETGRSSPAPEFEKSKVSKAHVYVHNYVFYSSLESMLSTHFANSNEFLGTFTLSGENFVSSSPPIAPTARTHGEILLLYATKSSETALNVGLVAF